MEIYFKTKSLYYGDRIINDNKNTHYSDPKTSATHAYITIYGALLTAFNPEITNISPCPYSDTDMMILAEYSEWPDYAEKDGAYKGHFYNPTTNLNYKDEDRNTAKTNFISHYNNASYYIKHGNRTYAMQELGKALHYLQYAAEPHHSNNKTALEKIIRILNIG